MKREQTANTVTFAGRLKNLMQERPQFTQKLLAERVGVTKAAVNRWLRDNRFPYSRHLNKLSSVLSVHREWLETGDGEKWLPEVILGSGAVGIIDWLDDWRVTKNRWSKLHRAESRRTNVELDARPARLAVHLSGEVTIV